MEYRGTSNPSVSDDQMILALLLAGVEIAEDPERQRDDTIASFAVFYLPHAPHLHFLEAETSLKLFL